MSAVSWFRLSCLVYICGALLGMAYLAFRRARNPETWTRRRSALCAGLIASSLAAIPGLFGSHAEMRGAQAAVVVLCAGALIGLRLVKQRRGLAGAGKRAADRPPS